MAGPIVAKIFVRLKYLFMLLVYHIFTDLWYNILMIGTKKSKKDSFTLKNSRSQIRRHDGSTSRLNLPQKIILGIITLLVLIVVVSTIFALKYDAKYQVEAKISDLAREYYEEYYYPSAFDSDRALASNYLTRYTEGGLFPVSLRQMLLLTPDVSESDAAFLEKYCDKNATSVTYFPSAPFAKDSYRAEFSYSCKYD